MDIEKLEICGQRLEREQYGNLTRIPRFFGYFTVRGNSNFLEKLELTTPCINDEIHYCSIIFIETCNFENPRRKLKLLGNNAKQFLKNDKEPITRETHIKFKASGRKC